jgi:hypothetical protein
MGNNRCTTISIRHALQHRHRIDHLQQVCLTDRRVHVAIQQTIVLSIEIGESCDRSKSRISNVRRSRSASIAANMAVSAMYWSMSDSVKCRAPPQASAWNVASRNCKTPKHSHTTKFVSHSTHHSTTSSTYMQRRRVTSDTQQTFFLK